MGPLDYFEVECPEVTGGEYYKRIVTTVLLDHDLTKVVAKIHIFIDPSVPLFIAVGTTKRLPSPVKVRDFANLNIEEHKVTISIGNEAYLAPFLKLLWEKFGKGQVEQPDRFTIVLALERAESEKLEDMVVTDPSLALYKDLIYAMQTIAPEGFKVRRQYYGKGKFYYIASENTLEEDLMPLLREKFALMGEEL
ncbi:MAG TPA: methanogenesis marker 17 protein [Methanoregulaceae archaeon]|nr:methanogenesis marker 17 protein [Methanoregulaceae archaeon]